MEKIKKQKAEIKEQEIAEVKEQKAKIKLNRTFDFVGVQFDTESQSLIEIKKSRNLYDCEEQLINRIKDAVNNNKTAPDFIMLQVEPNGRERIIERIVYNKENNTIDYYYCDTDVNIYYDED